VWQLGHSRSPGCPSGEKIAAINCCDEILWTRANVAARILQNEAPDQDRGSGTEMGEDRRSLHRAF
jgi:hypothetical protein